MKSSKIAIGLACLSMLYTGCKNPSGPTDDRPVYQRVNDYLVKESFVKSILPATPGNTDEYNPVTTLLFTDNPNSSEDTVYALGANGFIDQSNEEFYFMLGHPNLQAAEGAQIQNAFSRFDIRSMYIADADKKKPQAIVEEVAAGYNSLGKKSGHAPRNHSGHGSRSGRVIVNGSLDDILTQAKANGKKVVVMDYRF